MQIHIPDTLPKALDDNNNKGAKAHNLGATGLYLFILQDKHLLA